MKIEVKLKKCIVLIAIFALSSVNAAFSTTVTTGTTDVLILMDNSGSMGPHQVKFADMANNILGKYAGESINLGLITTDAGNNSLFVGSSVQGSLSEVISQLKKDIIRTGLNGSPNEVHMSQILRTLKEDQMNLFHRLGTELHVYIVTDEDEQHMTAKQFITELAAYKPIDKVIVNLYAPLCKTTPTVDWKQSELYFLSLFTGGTQNDLCQNN